MLNHGAKKMNYITEEEIQERAEENGWEGGRTCDPSYDLTGMNDIWDRAELELEREHLEQIFEWHEQAMRRMIETPTPTRSPTPMPSKFGSGFYDRDTCHVASFRCQQNKRMVGHLFRKCSKQEHLIEKKGWITGLEPVTTGTTIQCSTN